MIVRLRWFGIPLFAFMLASCAGADVSSDAKRGTPSEQAASVMPSARPSHRPHVGSVAEAVAHIRARMDIPVVLPSGLPEGVGVARDAVSLVRLADGTLAAQLVLRFPRGELIVQYGEAGFDGCEVGEVRHVPIGAHPAPLNKVANGVY